MDCDEVGCGMPAAGILWPDIPRNVALGRPLCRGHIITTANRHIDDGRPFTVAPVRVVVNAVSYEVVP